jgi:thioredoxin-like negative regulator of GroEL
MRPIWEDLAVEMPELKTQYIDADEQPEILKQYNVTKIPVLLFQNDAGQEVARHQGMMKKQEIIDLVTAQGLKTN